MPLRFLIILWLALAWSDASADPRTIRFNVSPNGYPPFTIVHEDGSHSGIIWDILTLIAERHGFAVEAAEIPRKRVDDFILEGRIDVTARAVEWTSQPERFAFTDPLLSVQEVFFKREEDPFSFTRVDALAGKSILTHLGYVYPRLAPLFTSGAAERFDVQKELEMLDRLRSGERFDLAVAVLQVGLWHIRQQGWQDQLDYAPQPLSEHGYRLMFDKDHQAFVTLFNRELQALKASGELKEILDRYR